MPRPLRSHTAIFCFVVLTAMQVRAQSPKMDSLNRSLRETTNDSLRLSTLRLLCEECPISENLIYGTMGVQFCDELLKKGAKTVSLRKIRKGKAFFYRIGALYYQEIKKLSEANQDYAMAIPEYEAIGDTSGKESVLSAMARNYIRGGEVGRGFDSLGSRLRYYEIRGNNKFMAEYLYEIGRVYRSAENHKKALEYFKRCRDLYRSSGNIKMEAVLDGDIALASPNKEAIVVLRHLLELPDSVVEGGMRFEIIMQLVWILSREKMIPEALQYCEMGRALAEKDKNDQAIADSYFLFATTYRASEDYGNAQKYMRQALEGFRKIGDRNLLMWRLDDMADILAASGAYRPALQYAEESEQIAKTSGNLSMLRELYLLKYNLYIKLGDSKNALRWHLEYVEANDSLRKKEASAALGEREVKLEYQRTEALRKIEQ